MKKKIISSLLLIATLISAASCAGEAEQTQASTDKETVLPTESVTDITEYLIETRSDHSHVFDFRTKTIATYREHLYLDITGSYRQDTSKGLVGNESTAGAIALNKELTVFPYTAYVTLMPSDNNRDKMRTAMAGICCKATSARHSQSGLWFYFDGDTAYVCAKSTEEGVVLADRASIDAKDGITVRFQGENGLITVYADDKKIASVSAKDDIVSVLDKDGGEVLTVSSDDVTFTADSHGFLSAETNKSSSSITAMGFEYKENGVFAPQDEVLGFKKGCAYSFTDRVSCYHATAAFEDDGTLYADVSAIAEMLDFECEADAESATLKRDGATLAINDGVPVMTVNGTELLFKAPISSDGVLCVSVSDFLSLLGYKSRYEAKSGILTCDNGDEEKSDEKDEIIKNNFSLYKKVVFNYDDVECPQQGVGKFEATEPSKRLVGIAYSPWNTMTKKWWKGAWGEPLCGIYANDDEDVLRYHAELLAKADVDFVFLDWSNNTYATEETYHQSEIYRSIEQTTYEMFRVWSTVPNAPKIALFLGPGHATIEGVKSGAHQRKADQVYDDFVTGEYGDMYFNLYGKPLLICYGATPTQYGKTPSRTWNDDRFTVRWMSAHLDVQSLCDRNGYSEVYWSWEEIGLQAFTEYANKVEAVTVSAAVRSGNREDYRNDGATFKRQMQRAYDLGARITIITTWNEWTGSEQKSTEQSRDIEPSTQYGTFYYDLMCEQIKKLKGKL